MVRLKLSADLPDRSPAAAVPPAQTATGAAAHSGVAVARVVSEDRPAIRPGASLPAIRPGVSPVAILLEALRVVVSQVVTVAVSRAAMVEGGTVENST